MGNLGHIGVVESHIAEDGGPEDAGQHEQDDSDPDQDLPDVLQRTFPVLLIKRTQRLHNVVPDDPEGVYEHY